MPRDGSDAADAFDRVPAELRAWRQWVCWRFGDVQPSGKRPKYPVNPHDGSAASVTDAGTWGSYGNAVAAALDRRFGTVGIGFVFAHSDPFAGVDLDDTKGDQALLERHERVHRALMPSYAERSPSRTGLHIIVRGSVPDGLRNDTLAIELYSAGRFFTMTGDVHTDAPIADCQDVLTALHGELRALVGRDRSYPAGGVLLNASAATQDDATVWAAAMASPSGPKLDRLARGDASDIPADRDRSGNAIDLALCNVIQHFTKDPDQIERLWRATPHAQGRAKKMKRVDYVTRTIGLAFDREIEAVDFTTLRAGWAIEAGKRTGAANDHGAAAPGEFGKETTMPAGQAAIALQTSCRNVATVNQSVVPQTSVGGLLDFTVGRDPHAPPPGMVGALAQFIFNAAHRQVPEIALAGALGWMAGVCGASYNVNGDGLNLYIALLAESGVGKSAVKNAYGIIRNAMEAGGIPAFAGFYGPGDFASGPGLLRVLGTQRAFVSLIGEFGVWLEEMGGNRSNPARQSLRRALLDLYVASGVNGSYEGTANAKLENSVAIVKQPAVTIIGETTPDVFYDAMTDNNIRDGFLARFIIFEYSGVMPLGNYDKIDAVPKSLLADIKQLVVFSLESNRLAVPHRIAVPPAIMDRMKALDAFCVQQVRASASKSISAVWARVVANVWKIASLVSIGVNYHSPGLDDAALDWATAYVAHSVGKLIAKLESGEVAGSLSEKQYAELMRVLREFPNMAPESLASYRLKPANLATGIVNATFLNRRLRSLPVFRSSGFHVDAAMKAAIARAGDEDILRLLPKDEAIVKSNGLSGTCYGVNVYAL